MKTISLILLLFTLTNSGIAPTPSVTDATQFDSCSPYWNCQILGDSNFVVWDLHESKNSQIPLNYLQQGCLKLKYSLSYRRGCPIKTQIIDSFRFIRFEYVYIPKEGEFRSEVFSFDSIPWKHRKYWKPKDKVILQGIKISFRGMQKHLSPVVFDIIDPVKPHFDTDGKRRRENP